MTTNTLPGLHLASSWLNCALASSEDENRPVLYRTILVEVFKGGVQLVATDSWMLLAAFVPTDADDLTPPPPTIDESPIETHVVMDPDKRMQSLMRFVLTDAKAAEKAGVPCDLTLSISSAESPSEPTLDPSLDRSMFIVQTDNERLALPIYEGDYPTWRALLAAHREEPTGTLALNPTLLGRFGKLKNFAGPISMILNGATGMIALSSPADESYLFGGVVPVSLHGDEQ